jgi:ATP-dependent DNA ligase
MNLVGWAMLPISTHKEEIAVTKWYAQPKLDGHRMCVIGQESTVVTLISKGGHQTIAERPPGWISHLSPGTTLDGELVGEQFYAFDILARSHEDVTSQPHSERMKLLKRAIPKDDKHFCLGVYQNVPDLWASVQTVDAEGIVLKDPRGIYRAGASRSWRKVKNTKIMEAIVSMTAPNKTGITAVLIHPHTDKNLGKVHTGRPVKPGDIVRVRYCQVYADGRLREATIIG